LESIIYNYSLFTHRRKPDHQIDTDRVYTHVSYWLDQFERLEYYAIVNLYGYSGEIWDVPQQIAQQNKIKVIEKINVFGEYSAYHDSKLNDFVQNPLHNVNKLRDIRISTLDDNYFSRRFEGYNSKLLVTTGKSIAALLGMRYFENINAVVRRVLRREQSESLRFHFMMRKMDLLHYLDYSRLYKSMAQPIDDNIKYIYFPIHLEPEATMLNKTKFNGQLFWIRSLSSILPKGVVLLIKEHPVMQFLSSPPFHHYQRNLEYFKSIRFLKNLNGLKNVRIAPLNMSSEELIPKSKMVATIMGSVSFEAIKHKKPLLILEPEKTLASKIDGIMTFSSVSTEDLDKIINDNNYEVKYDNFSKVINDYLFENDQLDLIKIIK
jgi:hypothetical protein